MKSIENKIQLLESEIKEGRQNKSENFLMTEMK